MVAKQGRIELTELSQLFGVSVVTIRKDVEILQERNSVRRVHGAVVTPEEDNQVQAAIEALKEN